MGYTTSFDGQFKFDSPLTVAQKVEWEEFCEQRHDEGKGKYGDKPYGYYCQWVPTKLGDGIEWDGGEKFYGYAEWLVYLINRFVKPWGKTLSGVVNWCGEESGDIGRLHIRDNAVFKQPAKVIYEEPQTEYGEESPV